MRWKINRWDLRDEYDSPLGVSGLGGGGSSTTVQKADPWKPQQEPLIYGFDQARNLYDSPGPYYYPGQTYADFSPQQSQALAMQEQRALNGSPVINSANNLLTDTLNGQYLDPSSRLQPAFDQARKSIDSQFAGSGRYGSGLHKAALGEEFGQIASGMYDQERNRQMQSMLFAPQMANQDYYDISMLRDVGNTMQQQAQTGINEDMSRWDYYQNQPQNKLNQYMATVGGGNYGGQTSTSGGGSSSLSNALGGGMMGLSAMNTLAGMTGGMVPTIAGLGTAGTAGLWGGAGALLGLLSDKRAKTDIKKVGKTDDGLNVYTYRYKFGGPPMMGVMAQEVEKKNPDAVNDIGGIKTVNYGLL